MVHSVVALPASGAFSLSVPSPSSSASSARRAVRSHSNASDEGTEGVAVHHGVLAPATPRRGASATALHSSSHAPPLRARLGWVPLSVRLPSFLLSAPPSRLLYRPAVAVVDARGHAVAVTPSLLARLLCALELPVYAFMLGVLLVLLVAALLTLAVLQANSLRLTYQFTSPQHPLTPHYPVDPATLNRTDSAGRLLSPDTLQAQLLSLHELSGVHTPHLEWMQHQAAVCVLVVDLCHPKDERYVRYKVVDRHQRRCLLYRVTSAQRVERVDGGDGEWRPHLSIVQTADRLPYALSYIPTISTVVEYAEAHGYAYYIRLVTEAERRGRHPSFGRALAAFELLHLAPLLHPAGPPPPAAFALSSHYVFYLDMDAYINTTFFLQVPLTSFALPGVDLHFQGEDTFCAAVFLARRSSLSLFFFEHVWAQGQFEYTRRHTWEQKAFTHTLNVLLSGRNGFHYATHCLANSCEPLYLRSFLDAPDRLWTQSWGAVAFWPLNRANSLERPQVHQCVWNRCPMHPGLVVHNGDHSNTGVRWLPDDAPLAPGVCDADAQPRERRGDKAGRKPDSALGEGRDAEFHLQNFKRDAIPRTACGQPHARTQRHRTLSQHRSA